MGDIARTVTSLDRPVGDDGETALGELLGDERAGPAEEVEVALRDEALRNALAGLPDEERKVVELRYGVDGADGPGRPARGEPAPGHHPARDAQARGARARAAGEPARAGSSTRGGVDRPPPRAREARYPARGPANRARARYSTTVTVPFIVAWNSQKYLNVPGLGERHRAALACRLIVPLSNDGEPPSSVSVCGASSALETAIFVPALTVAGSGS